MVEDHPLVRAGIESMLSDEKEINCIQCCATGHDLYHALERNEPDVILMDINLPDASGIDLCREVKRKYPAVGIIALSINNQPAIIRKMMESGANGYVLKDADQHEIVQAVKAVSKGKDFFSHSAVAAMRKPGSDTVPPLTRREKEILEWITNGLTNQQIANKIFVDVTTVISHKKNMLSKYGVKNSAELVKFAMVEKLI